MERDSRNQEELRQKGWKVIVVWECETKDLSRLAAKLCKFIDRYQTLAWREQASPALRAAEQQKGYFP